MYYAHAINMLGILYVLIAKETQKINIYSYSQALLFTQLLFLHPAPLMLVFIAIEYLIFRAFLRKSIGYRLISIIWILGPLLYIITLIPISLILIKMFMGPTPPITYHFPPQLGIIIGFFYYAVPGPFISLATLPKHLQLVKECNAIQLQRQ